MPVTEIGDPRLQALFGANDPRDAGVRPTVSLPSKGVPPAVLAFIAVLLGVLLFMVLNERRTRQAEPSVQERPADNSASAWTAPPPLYVPPAPQPVYEAAPEAEKQPAPALTPAPAPVPTVRSAATPAVPVTQPLPQIVAAPTPPPAPTLRVSSGSPLVIDTGAGSTTSPGSTSGVGAASSSTQTITRVRASAFANRSMTVPQGYLIPAVLETGFDSTKPGFARAIVSRDVRGFDGKNVLIPRGSRLIGEYKSATGQSQNRAVITWTRLIRPDGMTIMMDSPAVDTEGRIGVPASVNTHFFAKLGDALLQTTFGVGQALAGRAVTGPVVVLSGNTTATTSQAIAPRNDYTPTLKVPPGRSISVFVAHDLDFSAAAGSR
jgi:type IV secretion system protein VirB10